MHLESRGVAQKEKATAQFGEVHVASDHCTPVHARHIAFGL